MLRKLFIASLLLSSFHAVAQHKDPAIPAPAIDYKQVGAPMPEIVLETLDSVKLITPVEDHEHSRRWNKKHPVAPIVTTKKMITTKDLDNDATLLVMMFNPTCGHCEDQTDRFEKNIDLFKKTKLVLMANQNMREYLPAFIKNHHTKDFPSIIVGMDSGSFINKTFLYSALPQINIYSADRKLIRSFAGEIAIDTLKQYIR